MSDAIYLLDFTYSSGICRIIFERWNTSNHLFSFLSLDVRIKGKMFNVRKLRNWNRYKYLFKNYTGKRLDEIHHGAITFVGIKHAPRPLLKVVRKLLINEIPRIIPVALSGNESQCRREMAREVLNWLA